MRADFTQSSLDLLLIHGLLDRTGPRARFLIQVAGRPSAQHCEDTQARSDSRRRVALQADRALWTWPLRAPVDLDSIRVIPVRVRLHALSMHATLIQRNVAIKAR